MSEFMILVIVFISMLVLFYFLWVNGYMILNAKRALLFVGSLRGKNKCEVSFSSCSGYEESKIFQDLKRLVKFQELMALGTPQEIYDWLYKQDQ